MLSQEQLTAALKAFGEAVPTGTKLHSLKVTPSVGYANTEAKPVFVFVLADSDKDVQRLSQVINRGIKAFETEPGLTAALLRDQPQKDVFAEAAAQMNEAFPPRVHTATQDRADLERLYPKGGDRKSSIARHPTQQATDFQPEAHKALIDALERVLLDPKISALPPTEQARLAAQLLIAESAAKEKPQAPKAPKALAASAGAEYVEEGRFRPT